MAIGRRRPALRRVRRRAPASTAIDFGQRGGTMPDAANPITPVNPCGDPVTVTSAAGAGRPSTSRRRRAAGSAPRTCARPPTRPASTGRSSASTPTRAPPRLATRSRPSSDRERPPDRRQRVPQPVPAHLPARHLRPVHRPRRQRDLGGDQPDRGRRRARGRRPPCRTSAGRATRVPRSRRRSRTWARTCAQPCTPRARPRGQRRSTPTATTPTLCPPGPCFNPVNGKDGASPTGLAFYQGPPARRPTTRPSTTAACSSSTTTATASRSSRGRPAGCPTRRTWRSSRRRSAGRSTSRRDRTATCSTWITTAAGSCGSGTSLSPVARATADPDARRSHPSTVHLDGSASTDPDPAATLVAWRWDLDDDGVYDDATRRRPTTGRSPRRPCTPSSLEVESSNGLKDTVDLVVDATNDPPGPVHRHAGEELTWAVGDTIRLHRATPPTPRTARSPGTALHWDVVMLHCPADCHEHVVERRPADRGYVLGTRPPRTPRTSSSGSRRPTRTARRHDQRRAPAEDEDGRRSRRRRRDPDLRVGRRRRRHQPEHARRSSENARSPSRRRSAATIGGTRVPVLGAGPTATRVREVVARRRRRVAGRDLCPGRADTCATALASSPTGGWITDRADGNGDVDWFRVHA